MKIMAGRDKEFTGEAWAAESAKVGYLEQEPELDADKTVLENVMAGMGERKALVDEYNEVSAKFAEEMTDDEMNNLIARQAELQEKIDAADAWNLEREAEIAMDALRCPPADSDVTKLSGGERRRVALARLLLAKPDLLLLDEPTNHLDAESVAWLERTLREFAGTVVMITHDRYFLDNVTGWILEIDRGRCIPYEGNYSIYLNAKVKRASQEARDEEGRQKVLEREKAWMGTSAKGQRVKNSARIKQYEELMTASENQQVGSAQIIIPTPPRLGENVIEGKNITKSFGDKMLIEDFNFKLPRGGIVGIIGPNGAGKTTLFRMITGGEKPDSGEIKIGESVKLGYVDQSRDSLDGNKTIFEEISEGNELLNLGKRTMQSRAYVSSFNFKGSDQQKKVGTLSGGERNRVHLAKMLKSDANVLLLDEPTNDLDVDTLRALEDALVTYPGCAVIISHDRWFLNRIATHIMAFEGDSHVEWFEGNFEDYEADRVRRLGADALNPHRIKYKPLAR
jgi:ATP-binding cassette ChvD family protein